MAVKTLLMLILLVCGSQIQSLADQPLPDGAPKWAVLIQLPHQNTSSDIGTGILLHQSNELYIVTATHVIFNIADTNLESLIDTNAVISIGQDFFTLNLKTLINRRLIKRHPTHDVTVIHAGHYSGTNSTNITLESISGRITEPLPTFLADSMTIRFKDIVYGSDTYILGYPVELMKDNPIAAKQIDYSQPLIRKGIISQKNFNTGKIILDSSVYGGNSGGPVMVVERPSLLQTRFMIAGVVTEFVPIFTRLAPSLSTTNSFMVFSGYSVVEPIDYALELIQQEAVTNAPIK